MNSGCRCWLHPGHSSSATGFKSACTNGSASHGFRSRSHVYAADIADHHHCHSWTEIRPGEVCPPPGHTIEIHKFKAIDQRVQHTQLHTSDLCDRSSTYQESNANPRELVVRFLTFAKQNEKFNVVCDHYTALTTVIADPWIKEIPVERAESIGASHDCSVDDRVVIRVGRHYARSGAGKNNL